MRERRISGAHLLCRGTTHARSASEVERKVSNLVAHSPAERSSSYWRGGAGWKHPTRRDVSGFMSSNPHSPASHRSLLRGGSWAFYAEVPKSGGKSLLEELSETWRR
jgi:hypothetical protein